MTHMTPEESRAMLRLGDDGADLNLANLRGVDLSGPNLHYATPAAIAEARKDAKESQRKEATDD